MLRGRFVEAGSAPRRAVFLPLTSKSISLPSPTLCLAFGHTTASGPARCDSGSSRVLQFSYFEDFLSAQLSSVARPKLPHGEAPKNPYCAKGTAQSWCPRV